MEYIKNLTITELESYFNLTQTIIDTIIRTNHSTFGQDNMISVNNELVKYNKIRDIFLNEIVKRIEIVSGFRITVKNDTDEKNMD